MADPLSGQCLDVKSPTTFAAQDTSPQHLNVVSSFEQEITLPPSSQLFTSDGNNVVAFVSSVHAPLDSQDQTVVFTTLPNIQCADSEVLTLETNQNVELQTSNIETDESLNTDVIVLQPVDHNNEIENNLEPTDQSTTLIPQDSVNQMQQGNLHVSSETDYAVHFKNEMGGMVLATIQQISSLTPSMVPNTNLQLEVKNPKYFCLSTTEEVEEAIRKHTEETFSHFVVAKKTKAYGAPVTSIDITTKFRIHWQSRDLTTTEECAVQIPFEGVPFIYIGEKAYMCHLGRSKASKNKPVQPSEESFDAKPKRHRSRMTKKQGCPAKIFVKQIAKFPHFRIANNSEYLRTQMSQKLRKSLLSNNGQIEHTIQFIGTLPDISEHSNHDIGENTPVREPIDPLIRDKIIELSWEQGENAMPREIKEMLENYVENILFKGKTTPSKNRRRFYPSEKDIANYIYKSRVLSKLTIHEQDQLHVLIANLEQENPQEKIVFRIESEDQFQHDQHINETQETEDMNNPHNHTNTTEHRIIFSYQTRNQQRLLKRYGKQVILTEISKPGINLPFPLFGVFVPTNVDFQIVYSFVVQARSKQCLKEGLTSLMEWNSYWTPKFFVVDFSHDQIHVIESLFPSCVISISEISRDFCWTMWLNHPANIANLVGDKDEVFEKLNNIANSYTEETLNKAAQDLENSEVWKLSEDLRDWFSTDWLAEAKRWVVGYRHDDYFPTLHFEVTFTEELEGLRGSHYTHMKNKKIVDFLKLLVDELIPSFYDRYVSRNILDYRNQCLLAKLPSNSPSYLQYKPSIVIKHVTERMEAINISEYTINQIQTGLFWVQNKNEPDATYAMCFGDATTLPSCVCIDWLKYRLPCKHMLAVFQGFSGWGWDMLSSLYSGNPTLNMDLSCFDKDQLDECLRSADKKERNENEQTVVQVTRNTTNPATLSIVKPLMKAGVVKAMLNPMNVLTASGTSEVVLKDSLQFPTNLVTDCDTFCQELSNTIRQVEDKNMLQKVKLDLQLMLNDVKLEIAKIPQTTKLGGKRPSIDGNSSEINKKSKLISSVDRNDVKANNLLENEKKSDSSLSTTDTLLLTVNSDAVENISEVPSTNDQNGTGSNGVPVDDDLWIFDAELNIKLNKNDQKCILSGEPLSLDVIKSVQNVLRHQFSDVEGLCDPDILANHSKDIAKLSSDKKVVQLHMTDSGHWSASAKITENIFIFCCTLSSKATVIEQILKMTPENCLGDNILFIERVEKDEHIKECGLYAIAYTVAFAFDIEPRNLVFDESGMRAHLAESLEDMCFSMFPLKT